MAYRLANVLHSLKVSYIECNTKPIVTSVLWLLLWMVRQTNEAELSVLK